VLAPDADADQPNDDGREQDVDDCATGESTYNRGEAPSQPDPDPDPDPGSGSGSGSESDPRYLNCLKLAEAVNTGDDSLLHSLLASLDAGTLPPPDLSPPAINVFSTPEPAAQASAGASLAHRGGRERADTHAGEGEEAGHGAEGEAEEGSADRT
jgi:hypothetical protein